MPVAPELQREVVSVAALGFCLLTALALALSVVEGPALALRWWLVSVLCWKFVVWQCHKRLSLNCDPDHDRFYTTLGQGTRITLLRGLLIAGTAGFLVVPLGDVRPWLLYIPAALYTVAALGDWVDGYLARRQQHTTRLGTELDTALDAFGLLIAPLLAVLLGKLHFSYLLVSIAYYLFQGGIRWRHRRGQPVYPLPPSALRRQLAGLQMALVATVLWPPLTGEMTRLLGMALMIPLLLGFCRDWLHVSGRLGVGRERSV